MLGLRVSEVVNARWEWLKDGVYTVGGRTKSKRIRSIPVPMQAVAALEKMLTAINGNPSFPETDLIFPGRKGHPHVRNWLDATLKKSGIKGLSMHRLRATFATLHLRAGTPLKEVQEMLGHANATTTLIYLETDQAEKQKFQTALWNQT
jgi:integrase